MGLQDRLLLFGSTCELLIKDNEQQTIQHVQKQVDVVLKCRMKDCLYYQCLYCGKYSQLEMECTIIEAFKEHCFCGGDWIQVQRQIELSK